MVDTTATLVAETAPPELLQSFLGEHLADPTARISELQVEPILTGGYSGNRLYRARLAWAGGAVAEAGTATWVLKRCCPMGTANASSALTGARSPIATPGAAPSLWLCSLAS